LVFVDADEDLIMADDVVTPLNPLIASINEDEFEETSLDVNVSNSHATKNCSKKWCALKSII
jgi:hypothetical protein